MREREREERFIEQWSSEECNKGGGAGNIAQGGTAADNRREGESVIFWVLYTLAIYTAMHIQVTTTTEIKTWYTNLYDCTNKTTLKVLKSHMRSCDTKTITATDRLH